MSLPARRYEWQRLPASHHLGRGGGKGGKDPVLRGKAFRGNKQLMKSELSIHERTLVSKSTWQLLLLSRRYGT